MGGPITEFILLQATLADAVIITLISLPFLYINYFKQREWMIVGFGVVVAVLIEWYALMTSRWGYNSLMPIVPFLGVGLTDRTVRLAWISLL